MPTLAKPLDAIYQPIQTDLIRVEERLLRELRHVEGELGELTQYVSGMLGKRLRPALAIFSAQAATASGGGATALVGPSATGSPAPANQRVIQMAVAVELIHTATLVHDDVIDHATLRRGKTTVNARWGNTLAVLAGDYLYSQAFCLLSAIGSPDVLRLMSETSQRVCAGEVAQVKHQFDAAMDEATYLTIIREKTASLMAAACQAGAQLAGATPAAAQRLAAFGQAFGMAFQIVDDTHDVVGEEDQLGKSLGTDLEHGKMTLPLILLRDGADPATRMRVLDLLRHHENGSAQALKSLAVAQDVAATCLAKARAFGEAARAALEGLPRSAACQGFLELTDYILAR